MPTPPRMPHNQYLAAVNKILAAAGYVHFPTYEWLGHVRHRHGLTTPEAAAAYILGGEKT